MNPKIASMLDSYKVTLDIAGDKKQALKSSYLCYVLSYICQGITFSLFYPLLNVLFQRGFALGEALQWFAMVVFFGALALGFKWQALNFGFTSDLSDVTHALRNRLGKKLKNMPLQQLNKYRTGEINAILAQNVDDSVVLLGVVAGMAFESLVLPAVIFIATCFIAPKMALAIALVLPFSVPLYRWSRKLSQQGKRDSSVAHTELEADTIEYLQGLAVLRSINRVGKDSMYLQASIDKVRQTQSKSLIASLVPLVLMNTLVELVFLMILGLGAWWVSAGSFSLAGLVALLVIVNRINEPLANFLAIGSVLDLMNDCFKQFKTLLGIKNLPVQQPEAMPEHHDICFENVDFTYQGHDKKSVRGINCHICANALTAIVGESGSGKTTLTRLIMRYDDPEQGSVKIGGVDIRQMSQEKRMSLISVVFQDVYLFNDTIASNILMGKPGASMDEVMNAARKAHCHEFISQLPEGYETRVGDIGGRLSGGERQRISIARAILKNAPIVILDEPTSALDTSSEVAVQKALDELIADKTVIVIAHRLSTIAHADKILVLDRGAIIEHGSHEQLMERNGRYASLIAAQQRIKKWAMV